MWDRGVEVFLMVVDLPVTILTMPLFAPGAVAAAAGPEFVFAMYLLLGGLQWYFAATLVARSTCGFHKTTPLASRRFCLIVVFSLILIGSAAIVPWLARW
jgi:hypothetical protein